MTVEEPTPVLLEHVVDALETMGLVPFVARSIPQVAVIVNSRVVRIIASESSPVQSVAEWGRSLASSHADELLEAIRILNATAYAPKGVLVESEESVTVRFHHCFNWPVGASDEQVNAEVSQVVVATIAAMNRLDEQFPDHWAKEI